MSDAVLVPIPYSNGDPHIKCGVHAAKLCLTREGAGRLLKQVRDALNKPKQRELFEEEQE